MSFKYVYDTVYDLGMGKLLYFFSVLTMYTNFQLHSISLSKTWSSVTQPISVFSHSLQLLPSTHSISATLASLCFLGHEPQRFMLGPLSAYANCDFLSEPF